MTVMLNAYMSILSFVKQVKSPEEERGVQFHIIHLVSTTFSLFWSPLARGLLCNHVVNTMVIMEFKSVSLWFYTAD